MKKISLSFFLLLAFFTQVIICDNIIYFCKANYLIANIVALVLNIGITALLLKKKIIKIEVNFNKFDIVFLSIMFITIVLTIIFPDTFYDTFSYHIYMQENPFTDKINADFFPGRSLTSFVYPIADRVFYMFRSLLGFRLGTLPGYLLLVVMFYQIKKFLSKSTDGKVNEKYISLLSILPLGTFIILQQMGTYYIDNFSIAILLEFFYIILFESKDIFKEKARLYYLALITGIAICIKITNAIFVVLPLLYVLIKNIKDLKKIKIYDYILLVVTFVIPIVPYAINTITQTGSPVFPYYNTIFKSEYFQESNWVDARYGPKNIVQFLIWPIYIMIYPNKAYEVGSTDLFFAVGYIVSIICIAKNLVFKLIRKSEINKTNFWYAIFIIYLILIWEKCALGYTRYAGIIPVLANIFAIKLLLNAIDNKKTIMITIMSFLICFSAYRGCRQYMLFGSPNYYLEALKGSFSAKREIKDDIKKVFKDRKNEKYDIDGVWGVIYDESGIPTLLNVDDNIVELQNDGLKLGTTEKTQEIFQKIINENNIYVPINNLNFDNTLAYLNKNHFSIVSIEKILKDESFLGLNDYLYIAKIKYDENANNNRYILNEEDIEIVQEVKKENTNIKFDIAINPAYFPYVQDDSLVKVIGVKDGIEEEINSLDIPMSGEISKYEKDIKNSNYDEIIIRIIQDENEIQVFDCVMILNLSVE